jgi:chromosome segregation ATPase
MCSSALRKSRYPSLIAEIQEYIAERLKGNSDSDRSPGHALSDKSARLQKRVDEVTAQRDQLADHLNQANERILALSQRVSELEAKLPKSDVIKFPQKTSIKLDN